MTSMLSRKFLIAAAAAFLFACSHETDQAKVESVNAPVEVVRATAFPQLTIVSGTVRSANISPISAKLTGNVTRVLVSEGDRVRAGQPLLEIDARDVRAKADQALAGTAEVEQAIDGANAAVSAAEANANFANATYKRFAALRERGSVSPQEFEEVAAKKAGADAQLEQARRGRDALLARRNQARAAVAEAETFLGYSILRSPVDGIVTARMIDPGAMAAPGMPLLTVEETSHYRAEAVLDESLAQSVRQGDLVTLDDGNRRFDAHVTNITPSVDPSTRGALVKIDLPANSGLRSGTFVKVGFATGTKNAITVPETALNRRGELTSVYVVDKDGFARMRLVTLGDAQKSGIEVLSGLDDGERIVPQIPNELRDGAKVNVAQTLMSRPDEARKHS